ncbi:MAG TPA: hypothetical protein VGB15_16310 [Longimicrobium sp.]|jgi:hypothetical protein
MEDSKQIEITSHGPVEAAKVDDADLMRFREAGPSAGLISVAGGWPGSDELVREVEATGRTAARRRRR